MSVRNRIERLEQFRRVEPAKCPACGQRIYAVELEENFSTSCLATERRAQCIHCQGVLPDLPAGVVVKEYVGVSFADL